MRNKLLGLLMLLLVSPLCGAAQDFISLTPTPATMKKGSGKLVLPQEFKIAAAGLPEDMAAEVQRFIMAFNGVTDFQVTVGSQEDEALFAVGLDETCADEGYKLDVTAEKVTIKAKTSIGLFYAFQSVKKMLPANVMAGVRDASVTEYALPVVSITDKPRFGYRGFMLDVARHFFTVDEVKRMLDVMSYYKMNRFHWHLSDDQGWRMEIEKYPKLTTVGSIAPNSRFTDMKDGQFWINKPYGPYFYTKDQLREVVEYARQLHIEVIPEFDMPGHFVAALVSYPEFSCNPSAARSVWSDGGISSDVMNVADPKAVQFCKDILEEVMEVFPYEYIHIGGDECPDNAWRGNSLCQKAYEDLGLTHYRQLQSHFIKEMADFVKSKGRKLCVWNESITADGADTKLIQETGALVFCWQPAAASAKKAASLKLNNIFTPWGPYYICRKQSKDPNEPPGAGYGDDTVELTYNTEAADGSVSATDLKYYKGVQGTFWTEHVNDREYMEYLALPRLIAIAEAGWTPRLKKNFADFQKRITADTLLLNYGDYRYGKHYILTSSGGNNEKVMPKTSTADNAYYYRIVTRATDVRKDNCWELLQEGSSIIGEQAGKGAKAGALWQNAQAEEGASNYDCQLWRFEENPDNPGQYALVCKAVPDGSLSPVPTSVNTSGRWNYDNTAKHYDFVLGEGGYGKVTAGYYYTFNASSVKGNYMNASMAGQGFAVNLYGNPTDGNGGLWTCIPQFEVVETADLDKVVKETAHLLGIAKTYEGEKVIGSYGAREHAALAALLGSYRSDGMTAEELETFSKEFNTLKANFDASLGMPEVGKKYRFFNAVEGFSATALTDKSGTMLTHGTEDFQNDAWEVTEAVTGENGVLNVKLKNAGTGRFIGSPAAAAVSRMGFPVQVSAGGVNVSLTFCPETSDFIVASAGKNLFPVPANSITNAGIVSSGSTVDGDNAIRRLGAAWNIDEVEFYTYVCKDEAGNSLAEKSRSLRPGVEVDAYCPEFENYSLVSATVQDHTVSATYKRSAYALTYECREAGGGVIAVDKVNVPVGESHVVAYPEHDYFDFLSAETPDGTTLTPDNDMVISATYGTDAYIGASDIYAEVNTLEAGRHYLIYDAHSDRYGYRSVNAASKAVSSVKDMAQGISPYGIWTLETSGKGYKVKNDFLGTYVPSMTTSPTAPVMSKNGETWTFSRNSDNTWKIKGRNNVCWDGLGDGSLVGWNDPGHPYKVYEFVVAPYFEVTVNAVTDADVQLGTSSALVRAGERYNLFADTYEGYVLKSIEGEEALSSVSGHVQVKVIYQKSSTGIDAVEANADGEKQEIFDLSGRRLRAIQSKGLYIINGKKVWVK